MDYIIYFAITIGILVFVHEFGHFAAAKLCKMRVDVFAIGFGKRLIGWNKINGYTLGKLPEDWDGQGQTDYRLCLFPLGGYVKIAGMVDESNDTSFAATEPKPYEFRSKPTYQKLFVITAGVLMNLLLTLVIFWGINFFQGKQVFKSTTISQVEQNSFADQAGFQSFDRIISINDKEVSDWDDIIEYIFVQSRANVTFKIDRAGEEVILTIPHKDITSASSDAMFIFPAPTQPFVQDVMKNSPAEDAGIKAGDIFISIDGSLLNNQQQVIDIISSKKEENVEIVYLRNDDTLRTTVNPGLEGKIGIVITSSYTGDFEYKSYGFFEAGTHSILNIGNYTVLTFSMLKNVVTGKIAFDQAFGGPVKIAQYAARSADTGIISFLFFLAMLSLSLAIINILPIPALDGGHFIIILIEGIMGKELPIKAKIVIQNAGFFFLLALMAFIIYSDLLSL